MPIDPTFAVSGAEWRIDGIDGAAPATDAGSAAAGGGFGSALRAAIGVQGGERGAGGVRVAAIAEDQAPARRVYDPTHPDAGADGYVELPNVDTVAEMVDLITAQRAYEANVTAMQSAKTMFAKTLEILR